ncbi:hypothetical protein B0H15DRAFT_1028122 [Mycena belliarum]|uniref:Uncharacterized protein n=1 Tax=Mycena belliarum TaxID=1033014 RepID=A0AAD6TLF6_9AGAR|nr:hypothetical protein B0H15DRAFT_1028122 [Mycena belliae]
MTQNKAVKWPVPSAHGPCRNGGSAEFETLLASSHHHCRRPRPRLAPAPPRRHLAAAPPRRHPTLDAAASRYPWEDPQFVRESLTTSSTTARSRPEAHANLARLPDAASAPISCIAPIAPIRRLGTSCLSSPATPPRWYASHIPEPARHAAQDAHPHVRGMSYPRPPSAPTPRPPLRSRVARPARANRLRLAQLRRGRAGLAVANDCEFLAFDAHLLTDLLCLRVPVSFICAAFRARRAHRRVPTRESRLNHSDHSNVFCATGRCG